MRALCLPLMLSDDELNRLDELIYARRIVNTANSNPCHTASSTCSASFTGS